LYFGLCSTAIISREAMLERIPAVPKVALRQRESMAKLADSNRRQEKRSITPSAY
jgi:hypothetical protein